MNKLTPCVGTSVDYLISGYKSEKTKATLKNYKMLKRFKDIDTMSDEEQNTIIKLYRL